MPADLVWKPTAECVESSHLNQFIRRFRPECPDYASLHRWSVGEPGEFWGAVAEFCRLDLARDPDAVVRDFDQMPGAQWFVGARLNYAQNLLSGDPDLCALIAIDETGARRELSLGELRAEVAAIAAALRRFGVESGDRVAGILPNSAECVVAALATASVGAVWSSCSPEFGSAGLLDRLSQIEPKVLFGVDGYHYAGKRIDCTSTLRELSASLPTLDHVVMTRNARLGPGPECRVDAHDFGQLAAQDVAPDYTDTSFDHPLFIMFSSGTTGPPKCIVHSVGGTLLQHLKEHQLHTDIRAGDRVFYYTTTGWMMWNWLLSSLASGATLVLYDGAPMHPDPGALWRLADDEDVAVFGASARYLSALEKSGYIPRSKTTLGRLRSILSTGSPLAPSSFDYVYGQIKQDVLLASIAGGTDLISCFVLGNPMLPVYRGEIQCIGLGMDVRIFDNDGAAIQGRKGELVCTSPFPSMPICFWNDPDGSAYHRAYFERFASVWHHGDFAELTEHGGIIMHGRSDATLNPGGVRIGTAEIYRILETMPDISDAVVIGQQWDGDTRIILFIVPVAGATCDDAMRDKIRQALRSGASPRHVPARIVAVHDIPRTLNGKTSEQAVSDAVHGRPIGNLTALANPDSVGAFADCPELKS